jgi:hypothetical protein
LDQQTQQQLTDNLIKDPRLSRRLADSQQTQLLSPKEISEPKNNNLRKLIVDEKV